MPTERRTVSETKFARGSRKKKRLSRGKGGRWERDQRVARTRVCCSYLYERHDSPGAFFVSLYLFVPRNETSRVARYPDARRAAAAVPASRKTHLAPASECSCVRREAAVLYVIHHGSPGYIYTWRQLSRRADVNGAGGDPNHGGVGGLEGKQKKQSRKERKAERKQEEVDFKIISSPYVYTFNIRANVLYTDPVLQKIRHQTRLLRECGHDVTIHWVPGHCGIPGNEKAHRLARAHLLTALARASDTPSTFLATPPELADPIADKHITKQRRAAYLTAVGNPLSIPLLPSKVFTRRESVLLRRIQAGTLLTPFLLNRFHRGDTPPPVTGLCSTCNCRADLNHLCWECPVYNPPRLRALATIKRGPWPSSLRTWACPEPSPPDRAIEFWRALIMFLQDPAAPPVGDRLRDSHKIQAIQAAPT
ncbi:hypothetical protein HPB51_020750 [Rhipicephalus microplus]|uniref:RNase H type-1 domain-containing protein n=1 Tax=Rhipicephalus microplus TaxID=6941 RepID=A0A9J6DQ65_RHIMP|nr:hypothetical protein HPB51_020750 [Rhipicephalus microplus]